MSERLSIGHPDASSADAISPLATLVARESLIRVVVLSLVAVLAIVVAAATLVTVAPLVALVVGFVVSVGLLALIPLAAVRLVVILQR